MEKEKEKEKKIKIKIYCVKCNKLLFKRKLDQKLELKNYYCKKCYINKNKAQKTNFIGTFYKVEKFKKKITCKFCNKKFFANNFNRQVCDTCNSKK